MVWTRRGLGCVGGVTGSGPPLLCQVVSPGLRFPRHLRGSGRCPSRGWSPSRSALPSCSAVVGRMFCTAVDLPLPPLFHQRVRVSGWRFSTYLPFVLHRPFLSCFPLHSLLPRRVLFLPLLANAVQPVSPPLPARSLPPHVRLLQPIQNCLQERSLSEFLF